MIHNISMIATEDDIILFGDDVSITLPSIFIQGNCHLGKLS